MQKYEITARILKFSCICRVCVKEFHSTNELDTDGGLCDPCNAKKQMIARKVDADQAAIRAARGPSYNFDDTPRAAPGKSGFYFESGN